MRYYKIVVGDRTWESYTGGKNVPGALNVELDIPVTAYASPFGAGGVSIWGVSLQDIGQASDFNGKNITIYAGFQKGLPLANPGQSGIIVQGSVFQATGNWIDVNQNLFFVIQPSTGTNATPENIILNWKKGTKLADALQTTLSTALPDLTLDIKISDNLVLAADEYGYYQTLTQFASYVKIASQNIIGGNYAGVDMTISDTTIKIYDGSTQTSPTQIAFQDMIGQPTWLNNLTVQTHFAMRADLAVGDYIKFPAAQTTTNPGSTFPGGPSQKSVFQGVFQINQMRHVGNFRQPDAESWVTVVDANSVTA